jgi:hypothetical protein
LLFAFWANSTGLGQSAASGILDLGSFTQAPLTIRTRTQNHAFTVWLAATQQQQTQGLMFVRELPADRGMLFVQPQPRVASMWMKNTYIPLDILFIDRRGRIVKIAAQTKPHSLDNITAPSPVLGVLELKGGETEKRGIEVGDRVLHPAFAAPRR